METPLQAAQRVLKSLLFFPSVWYSSVDGLCACRAASVDERLNVLSGGKGHGASATLPIGMNPSTLATIATPSRTRKNAGTVPRSPTLEKGGVSCASSRFMCLLSYYNAIEMCLFLLNSDMTL